MRRRTQGPLRERHHRLPRETYLGQIDVALTACVAQRAQLFTDATVVGEFIALLRAAASRHDATILLYCFMPDHLHAVLRGLTPRADVWRAMVSFKQSSGYWLRHHGSSHRWQKDFFDRVIYRDRNLPGILRYIAANPVRAGLVREWQTYPYLGSDDSDVQAVLAER